MAEVRYVQKAELELKRGRTRPYAVSLFVMEMLPLPLCAAVLPVLLMLLSTNSDNLHSVDNQHSVYTKVLTMPLRAVLLATNLDSLHSVYTKVLTRSRCRSARFSTTFEPRHTISYYPARCLILAAKTLCNEFEACLYF